MLGFRIFIAVSVVLVMWLVGIFNGLVGLRNNTKNAYSQIDVQLKRRHDLIPNLVETCKAYMAHEKGTLEAVITARNAAVSANKQATANPTDPEAISKLAAAEGALTLGLNKLLALHEAYPDLKANQNMMQLTEELSSTENKIAFARQAFNDSVMSYNTAVESFPNNILAAMYSFKPSVMWQLDNLEDREPVAVKF